VDRFLTALAICIIVSLLAILVSMGRETRAQNVGSYANGALMVSNIVQADTPCHISSATTTSCKGTPGTISRIIIGTPIAAASIKVYDMAAAGCSGTPSSGLLTTLTLPLSLTNPPSYEYNMAMANGICVVTSGATDLVVTYQ
jgi:hypothetical protein